MTNAKAPTEEQIAAARALVAEADARAAADRNAKTEAAATAVKDLVASEVFKAGLVAMESTLEAAPKVTELAYAVNMMERLRDQFAS